MYCMKSELDVFELPPLQTNVTGVEQVVYNPSTSLNNSSSIEFVIPGSGDSYKNLSSIYLRLLVKINGKQPLITEDGKEALQPEKIGVVNNLLHSLFRQCTVTLNNVQVSQDNDYHYKSFFQTILNYGNDATSTHLATTGWSLDEQNLDSLLPSQNPQHGIRNSWFQTGKEFDKKVELYGKLHVDLFNQPKFLINNVDLKITLNKEKGDFYMMESSTGSSDISILEANLFVEHIHVNPAILLAHHQMLQKSTAKYPYKRMSVRQYSINSGTSTLALDNIILGQKPNILLFAMLCNSSYCGSRDKNPYFFKSFGLEQFVLYVDGKQIPSKPLVMEHSAAKGKLTSRAYNTLFNATGIKYFDKGHQITKQLFDSCYFMLAFDLTADHSYSSVCINPPTQCCIRAEGSFNTNLSEAITCLVVCEFDAMIEIDKNGTVAVTI